MGTMTGIQPDWAQEPYPSRQSKNSEYLIDAGSSDICTSDGNSSGGGGDSGSGVNAYSDAQPAHGVVARLKPQECVQLPGLSSLLPSEAVPTFIPNVGSKDTTPASGLRLSSVAQSSAFSGQSDRLYSRQLPASYHQTTVATAYPVTNNNILVSMSASPRPAIRQMSVTGLLSDVAPGPKLLTAFPQQWSHGPEQSSPQRKAYAVPSTSQRPSGSNRKHTQAHPPAQQQQQPQATHWSSPGATTMLTDSGPAKALAYRIWMRQQPLAARSCGFGERDRRVIDPPPIVQLKIDDPGGLREEINAQSRFQSAVLHCSIWDKTGEKDNSAMPEDYRQQRRLMGTLVSSPFVGKDEHGEEGCFFCFPDLSCRTTGAFRLKFALVVLDPQNMRAGVSSPILDTTMSDVFVVYNAKDFPGMQASTALTKQLKVQGCLISIKRGNDKTNTSHDCWESGNNDDIGLDDGLSAGKNYKRARRMG